MRGRPVPVLHVVTAMDVMWVHGIRRLRAMRPVATAVFLFLVSMPVTVVRGLVVLALVLTLGFIVTGWGR